MISQLISQLAELCGIEPFYYDIWGQMHHVSEETKVGLLEAMGVATGDEAALRAAIVGREEEPWRQAVAPVAVFRQDDLVRLSLRLPEAAGEREIHWILALEGGEERQGRLRPAGLPAQERRQIDGGLHVHWLFELAEPLPAGYHRLTLKDPPEGWEASTQIIVTPRTCYTPPGLEDENRVWGPAVQVYALRSARNWGVGDFSDLKGLMGWCGEAGAGILGINPIHILFPENPVHASPYSPSSRRFLNFLYLDPEATEDFQESEPAREAFQDARFQARLSALRETELVDYPGVAEAKRQILEILWEHFQTRHLSQETPRGRAFRAYQAEKGEDFYRYGVFEALQEHFHRQDPNLWGWPVWPEPFQDPASQAVAEFAAAHRDRVEFFHYLQWLTEGQLAAVGRLSMELGLRVGLYQDLPISVDSAGVETWEHADLYALGARVGAPPDDFNLNGQDWGLPPLIPERLRQTAYAPFIRLLRANMRYAGALRIDHVMGLMRLFWIPPGKKPADGAYVRYPVEDLLGILALESQRNRCLIIGEDLGTVPDELRQSLAPLGVLSYRLFYFEKDRDGHFKAPADYPAQALCAVTTHDLPTLAGYWKGRDIALRTELDLFPADYLREAQIVGRAEDRARLLLALDRESLLPEGTGVDPASVPDMTPELAQRVHAYLARTPSKVLMFQMEDVLGQMEQANLPGTVTEHPNWRRKLPLGLDDLLKDPRLEHLAASLRKDRGRGIIPRAPFPSSGPSIPGATYRLQLNKAFTFRQAADLVPYLHDLGVTHIYCSPYLKARPGSLHGYDIIDHGALNPEIGSSQDFDALVEALRARGMGQILDMVPNHMGVGADNRWWVDVLENGQASPYAAFFDIDWQPLKEELRGKVLLPVLEDTYGSVLEQGLLRLTFAPDAGAFHIEYHEHRYPIDPASYPRVLHHDPDRLRAKLSKDATPFLEFESLAEAFDRLAGPGAPPDEIETRLRDKEIYKRRLSAMCREVPAVADYIAEIVVLFNGEAGRPESFDLLHGLLEVQPYRLAYWRVAADEINYRRFFDINDLAGLRMEAPEVFAETHRLVLDLIRQGKVQGLRIDHPDGLYDPMGYFVRLQAEAAPDHAPSQGEETPQAALLYLVVEKILAESEQLPKEWPVFGTTGYDFANLVGGLFVDAKAKAKMTRLYARFLGREMDLDDLIYDSKKLIMKSALASELSVLASILNRISESDRHTRDYTLQSLRDTLAEIVACFPVYRTYVTRGCVSREDRHHLDGAVAKALARNPAMEASVFRFVHRVLLLEAGQGTPEAFREALSDFAMKFQQYTGPVMAKGLEDTAFYIYNRLLSLNEVGGDPSRFGVPVPAFHRANRTRARNWPGSLLATSTHDTKRSEDVRARIHILSEIPGEWEAAVLRWSRMNRAQKTRSEGRDIPSSNDEYALYQTLLGAWPLEALDAHPSEALPEAFRDRVLAAAVKSAREAKIHTSWINPNATYEKALASFIRGLLDSAKSPAFLDDFLPLARKAARLGMLNSLSQTALKLTAPGVPDIFQGEEIWRLCLVDPDNRRPVDFGRRRELLAGLKAEAGKRPLSELAMETAASLGDGRAKLLLTWKALCLRRDLPELFLEGDYLPLAAKGPRQAHLCAFARSREDQAVIAAVPRLWAGLLKDHPEGPALGAGLWEETGIGVPEALSGLTFQDILTGKTMAPEAREGGAGLSASGLFTHFPVAILVARGPEGL